MTVARSSIVEGGFLDLRKGAFVSFGGKACKIHHVISVESLVIQYLDTRETERVQPSQLRRINEAIADPEPSSAVSNEGEGAGQRAAPSQKSRIADVEDDDWKAAKKSLAIIQPLLDMPHRTRADVERVAAQAGFAASTLFRWIAAYRASGHLSSLLKASRGRKAGSRRLLPEQEAIIADQIEKYMDPQAITPATVIDDVNTACAEHGVKAPSAGTIRNRIADVPLKRRMQSRGNSELAQQRFEATPGSFPHGTFPLECIQIDHVQLDLHVVDTVTREPITQRPWLTLVIECFSRMILGYFLSLARPSAFGTGVALYMGMLPKDELLRKLSLPGRWPVYGKFRKVLCDNAKEFKGEMLQRACDEHAIDLQLRPRKKPRYGAYIESMVGNVNRQLHKKRGTTHRKPNVSPDYDALGNAIYTLATLEVEIVDWIVNDYHVNKHSSLNTTPLRKWETGLLGNATTVGIGLPPVPLDPEKLRLDFLPFEKRVIHPYGVEIDRLYYHEVLRRWIGVPDPDDPKSKRKFIFCFDPRTIRHILFWDPEVRRYFEIPLRDPTWPDISWSEYAEYRRMAAKECASHVDEAAIKGYVLRSKQRERQEAELTREARTKKAKPVKRGAERVAANPAHGANLFAATPVSARPQATERAAAGATEDVFGVPVEPFEVIKR